jgi:putative hydrolase of HD superfamily
MTDIRDLHSLVITLKKAQRRGWIARELDADTIAEHSYGVIVVGWYLATEEKVDVGKVIEMLLVHDLVMAKMEDVTPITGGYEEKEELEQKAKQQIAEQIPESLQEKYLKLFNEFNERKTKEAIVAREADKLETLLQGEAYEEKEGREIIGKFFDVYKKYFETDTGKKVLSEIKSRHEEKFND